MSVTTTAAVAIIANNAAAKKAKDHLDMCKDFVVGYTHNEATVVETQQYVQCINTLHPQPQPTPSDLVVFKGAALTILVCMVIGAVRGYRNNDYDRTDNIIFGALGGSVFAVALLFVISLIYFVFV